MTANHIMYKELSEISIRPQVFSAYTAEKLWNDPHISRQMLKHHLNPNSDIASRNHRFIEHSLNWISKKFGIDSNKYVADFGCGPGLYSMKLARFGAHVTGIDFSKNSIEYAKKQAASNRLEIEYINENYLQFNTEKKFDLILLIFLDFCPLNPEQRKQLLSVFYKCLKDTGSILIDLLSINAFYKKEESSLFEHNLMDGFWSEHDYFGFMHCFKYDNFSTLDKYTIVEKSGTWHVYNWFQYYSKEMIKDELLENNFIVTEYYSDVTGNAFHPEKDEFVVIAKKKV